MAFGNWVKVDNGQINDNLFFYYLERNEGWGGKFQSLIKQTQLANNH